MLVKHQIYKFNFLLADIVLFSSKKILKNHYKYKTLDLNSPPYRLTNEMDI